MILLVIFIPILILFVLSLLFWFLTNLVYRHLLRKGRGVHFKFFKYTTLALSSLWISIAIYGHYWGRWQTEVHQFTYQNNRIPEGFDGFRIVHISDLHLEGFNDNPASLDSMVSQINMLNPDLVCFTGDIVSYNHQGLSQFYPKLAKLKAKHGVISILGNHDYAIYDRSLDSLQREADLRELISLQRDSLHWKLLLNENTILYRNNDSITIIGVENQACGFKQKIRRGNLAEAMKGASKSFQILLSHDPTHWDAEVVNKTDIPLTLSGHTHAMQFKMIGIAPSRIFFSRSDGMYAEGNQTLYINTGLGQLLPIRVGVVPEISLITLKH